MRTRTWAALTTAGVYGIGLGAASIVMPLLAVHAGYTTAEVGYLATISAVAQITTRLLIGWLLHRVADRYIVTASAVFLMLSLLAVVVSTSWVAFLTAMALQGASRAGFWTGLQTHVVRGDAAISKGLAAVSLLAEGGQFVGPIIAGYAVEVSHQSALYITAGLAGLATATSLCMRRLPPFRGRDGARGSSLSVGRNRLVIGGCVGVGLAGAWRALLSSYIPVVLADGGQSPGSVGLIVALASAASTAAAGVLVAVKAPRSPLIITASAVAVGLGLAPLGFLAASVPGAIACVVVAGGGAGVLQILGMSIATEAVHPEDRGKAIALVGVARSAAMVATPVVVVGFLLTTTLATALGLVGGLLGTQAAVLQWAQQRR